LISLSLQLLLRGIAKHELLEQVPQGELILGMLGERITASFDFYAAFQTNEEFTIRCGQEEIGKLPAGLIPPVGEHLLLGGKRWEVREIIFNQKLVLVTLSPGKKPIPIVLGSDGEIHTRVLQEMKTVLMNQDEPAYVDQNSQILLRAARQTAAIASLDKTDVVFGGKAFSGFRGSAPAL
jgi:ATP-dependent helicase Lhr and Lhr-like helicase